MVSFYRGFLCCGKMFFKVYRNYTTQVHDGVRVRFAPSPTGMLHLGGIRTALYNYLFAKSKGGTFILRIEDTDQTRIVPGAVEKLTEMLVWAGLQPDEGPSEGGNYGPYKQSERLDVYQKHVQTLLQNGQAYRCFCSDKRLMLRRKEALRQKGKLGYDGKCRLLTQEEVDEKLAQNQPYAIRFKLDNEPGHWKDLVYGNQSSESLSSEGDFIITKSDGYPTYHFANVVDDHTMQITHVLRGVEWMVSTPKHILMYNAFGWTPPTYAHLPLLTNESGTKLSKRQGDVDIEYFRAQNYHPETILNYVTISGGGFESSTEGLTLQQMVEEFNINRLNQISTRLQPERLHHLNCLHFARLVKENDELFIRQLRDLILSKFHQRFKSEDTAPEQMSDARIRAVLHWSIRDQRASCIQDLVSDKLDFIWVQPSGKIIPKLKDLKLNPTELLESLIQKLEGVEKDFDEETLEEVLNCHYKEHQTQIGPYMKLLRTSLSELKEGPPVKEMMTVLGKRVTLTRLKRALDILR